MSRIFLPPLTHSQPYALVKQSIEEGDVSRACSKGIL